MKYYKCVIDWEAVKHDLNKKFNKDYTVYYLREIFSGKRKNNKIYEYFKEINIIVEV